MKHFLKKHWPLVGILLLLLVALFYLINPRKEILEKSILSNVLSREGFRLEDIHYSQDSPEEGMRWVLDAKEARISKDRQFVTFKHFRLKLEPKGRPSVEIEGENGEYDKGSGEINLRDNLRGRTDNGYRIMTDHILYQQREGYLTTECTVRIKGPSFSLRGKGLYVDLRSEVLRLHADVIAVIENEAVVL